jgi:glucosamine--fructose-6-phosphate aminotransferase (isomerizing)
MIPDEEAHPHIDYKGRIALCHNGLITNYEELLIEIKEKNYPVDHK